MAAQVGEPPTVATDETLSQPSTSAGTDTSMREGDAEAEKDPSSDSDASIGWGDYEHRKDVIVKRLVLCEQQMSRMKVTAKFTRLKDYEKRREAIRTRTDAEYLARVAAMEKEVQKEQDKQRTHYDLELQALERANEGETDFINRGFTDRLQYRKSQMMYDAKLKIDKLLERIWKEDEVRADARIFVGEEVPDDWLDEFVKTYVDEQEERENSAEAVRQRNIKRYRKEAGESLDTGQSLSAILSKAEAAGHWAHRSALQRLPKRVHDEQERRMRGRDRRRQMEKIFENRLKTIRHKTIGRFFGGKCMIPESEWDLKEEQSEGYEEELMEREEERTRRWKSEKDTKEEEEDIMETPEREPEVIRLNEKEEGHNEEMPETSTAAVTRSAKKKRGKKAVEELRRVEEEERRSRDEEEKRIEVERLEKKRHEQMRQKRLEKMELEKSEESCSDEDKLDLAATVRQGVRAILMTNGMPFSALSTRRERRVGRLKNALRTMLEMKREFSADPELRHVRFALMEDFVGARKKGIEVGPFCPVYEGAVENDIEKHLMEGTMEERIRNSSMVRGLVRKSLKRPMAGDGWIDKEGMAKAAVEKERRRREELSNYFASMKMDQSRKPWKTVDSESEWEEVSGGRKKKRKDKVTETIYAYENGQKLNGKTSQSNEMTENERMEKEAKMREIRAVIMGRDPKTNDEKEKTEEEEFDVEDEIKKEINGAVNGKNPKNGRRQLKPSHMYSSDDDDDYDNHKKRKGYGSVPNQRLATRPPQPRLKLQLSQERILKDLYRSGALRQRETYGEHIERLDKERRTRLLSSLPSTSSGDYGSRVHLLSPRSRLALDELPVDEMTRVSKRQRRMILGGLPSSSKCSYNSSEEDHNDESDEDEEELSEGWELEEEGEKEAKIEEEEQEEEEVMEVDSLVEDGQKEVKEEEIEEPRKEEKVEASPPNAVDPTPLLREPTTKKKKSATRMNGFSRTGTATAV